MKRICLLLFFVPILNSCLAQDSTIRQRFIVSILNEYDLEGRWLFLKIDSCGKQTQDEIVNPIAVYKSYSESFTPFDKAFFVSTASTVILEHGEFDNCPALDTLYGPVRQYEIKGIKVNMEKYFRLSKIPINDILAKFFDKNRRLKKKHTGILHELIALCYKNNIKVITFSDHEAVYEVFK